MHILFCMLSLAKPMVGTGDHLAASINLDLSCTFMICEDSYTEANTTKALEKMDHILHDVSSFVD